MVLTLPVTLGLKLALPDMAFLNQMWLAGLTLLGIVFAVSMATPVPAAAPVAVVSGPADG